MHPVATLLGLALLSLVPLAIPSHADPVVVYKCEMTKVDRSNFIGKELYFEIDEAQGRARVLEAHTAEYAGGIMPVDRFQVTDKRYRFKWTLRNLKTLSLSTISRVQYTASMHRTSLKLRVDAILSQYDNSPWAEGPCKRVK